MDLFELGALIRATRRADGLTQVELAQRVGITRQTLLALEAGQVSDLGIRKVMAILDALSLDFTAHPRRGRRPTFEQVMEQNAAEEAEHEERVRGQRVRG